MAVLKTVYETTTGKPVFEGFGSDPRESASGCSVIETELPDFEELQEIPACGTHRSWVMDGARVLKNAFSLSELSCDGLTATLGIGHFFGEIHAQVTETDSYTFTQPEAEVAIALDVVRDQEGTIQLQPYQWSPGADPMETKGDPPPEVTVVKADLFRGILPAGALSLAELQVEV